MTRSTPTARTTIWIFQKFPRRKWVICLYSFLWKHKDWNQYLYFLRDDNIQCRCITFQLLIVNLLCAAGCRDKRSAGKKEFRRKEGSTKEWIDYFILNWSDLLIIVLNITSERSREDATVEATEEHRSKKQKVVKATDGKNNSSDKEKPSQIAKPQESNGAKPKVNAPKYLTCEGK